MTDTWYAPRRELITNHTGGVFHRFRLVQEVWLVPSDDPNVVAEAAAVMRQHPNVLAGIERVRTEEFTWRPEVKP